MHRNTIIFIGVLAAVTVLLGVNYYTQPFWHRFEQPGPHNEPGSTEQIPDSGSSSDKLSPDDLTAEQKIGQLIAYPLVINTVAEQGLQEESESDEPFAEIKEASAAGETQDVLEDPKADDVPIDGPAPILNEELINQVIDQQILEFKPGLVTLFGSNISFDQADQVTQAINRSFADETFSPLIAVDHEGGSVQRLSGEGFLQLPDWEDVCQLERDVYLGQLVQSAQELQAVGVNIVFAPVVDIGGSVMGKRSCNDARELLPPTKDFIKAFGVNQIMPVLKHFPGIGNTTRDLHQEPDEITLHPDSLLIYSSLLKEYPNIGVMTTHVKLVNKFEGMPCSLSRLCLNAFSEQYPEILVFTDALNMGALEVLIKPVEADAIEQGNVASDAATDASTQGQFQDWTDIARQAILAGNDILVFGPDISHEELSAILDKLVEYYQSDVDFAQRVDESVQKIIRLK